MNVSEVARRLKMNTKELLETLPELGFDIGKRAIKVDDRLVDKIIMAVEEDRKKKRIAKREGKVKEIKLGDKDKDNKKEAGQEVKIGDVIIVNEFAEKLGLPVTKVIAELMKNGIMSTLNERIDFETATIIGEDLDFKIVKASADDELKELSEEQDKHLKKILAGEKDDKNLVERPPVVVVMGHVDHGKTKLLDAIRSTNVAEGESGGITQHIGAYQVEDNNKLITFLDTPGHEAFKAMRARGSKIADVAIIIVAADEGFKPQTLEVIDLVQKEKLPFVVAINKIDKEGADVEKVKKDLSEINLIPEDWGGKTVCVPISAKENKNIKELLDTVLLVADLEEFKANPNRDAVGTIIESHVDKGQGPVATALVQSGTLNLGDMFIVGKASGKVKAMKNYKGDDLKTAGPSTPVKILGLKGLPQVGDILEETTDKKKLKAVSKNIQFSSPQSVATVTSNNNQDDDEEEDDLPKLTVVLKTDVLGSQEAILEAFEKFKNPDIELKVIKKGLGNVTDVDIMDAETAKAIVLAYRVNSVPSAKELSRDRNVPILDFDIIYKLLEDIEERLNNLLSPETVRRELGKIKVLAIFKRGKKSMVVGGKVIEGKAETKTKVKVMRGDERMTTGDLTSLQAGKEEVREVVKGQECGLEFTGDTIIEEEDVLEIYEEKVEKRILSK
ncbi:translation initiation factor IF-2 [bacterium]|jgi:translation initiation factor IF-2|nr:translation initiation factor IF-2 [bacterium]